jgi:hypothetical protein
LRQLIERMAAELPDTDALEAQELFPKWSIKHYAVDDRVRYGETLYKCLTEHDAQEDWTPDTAPSLWVRVDDPTVEFPEWIQPVGSTDVYNQGAKVSHNEKHWTSDIDGNVWEPGVYGWTEVE